MAHEVVMPQLGLAMESGRIVSWLKQSGDMVKPGEVLLEVETDKATIEVEAVAAGVLHVITPAGDADVSVGATIGLVLADGEAIPAQANDGSSLPIAIAVGSTPAVAELHAAPASTARRAASTPAARRLATELGVDWRQATPTGTRGQIRARDVHCLAAAQAGAPATAARAESLATASRLISPLAQRMAQALGVEPALLTSLYPNQRITRDMVEATVRRLLEERGQLALRPAAPSTRTPLSNLRRLIADRMSSSAHTAAAVTLTSAADATELVRLRQTLHDAGTAPSYNVILAKVLAMALREHPNLNSTVDGDDIILWSDINIGIAVDTERGLVVPVLHDVDNKTLAALGVEGDELLGRVRAGNVKPDELTGGTFTLTNLGAYRIDAFTPIINPPQCAILGVGRIARHMVVNEDDSSAIRSLMTLSLTFDHRAIDGAPAARFLDRVRQFVEEPYLWLGR